MTEVFQEALFADDDDADLSNGTPHQCEILEGFGLHGLGYLGSQGVKIRHTPLQDVMPDTPIALSLELPNPAPDCFDTKPIRATAHLTIDGESSEIELDVSDAEAFGTLPGLPVGTFGTYWIEVESSEGAIYQEPQGGPIRPHSFQVGDVLQVYCDRFNRGHAGWTSELVSGEQAEGADDWQWGEPIGWSGDPIGCYEGEGCWGNDLGGGNWNGAYQDGKHNRLLSPDIDRGHFEGAFLHYQRWLSVEDGRFDRAEIFANGEVIWANYDSGDEDAGAHHQDDAWAAHVVPLPEVDEDNRRLNLEFHIRSDENLAFGGWNIDDVCIYAPNTPNNRLGVSDFVANRPSNAASQATLVWTNPKFEPLMEVRLQRSESGYPTGPNDGETIWSSNAPALDATQSVADDGLKPGKPYFYAVYAYDGETWLDTTRPGFNADVAPSKSGDTAVPGEGEGCGCNQGPTPGSLLWIGLPLVAGAVRRKTSFV